MAEVNTQTTPDMDIPMPQELPVQKFTITFSDGSQLSDLTLSQNVFTSQTEVAPGFFDGKLDKVVFTDGFMTVEHGAMTLVSCDKVEDHWEFEIRDLTKQEVMEMNLRGDISFLAMMSDVDLTE